MSVKKEYSAAAHLIHSRMELIRHKLDIPRFVQIATLAYKYKEYFDKAAASVEKQHNIVCEYKDSFDAAELLYLSTYPPPGKNDIRYDVVQFMDNTINQWVDIKWWDKENGHVPADPEERLDHGQALDRLSSMKVGRLLIFRIYTKYAAK